MGLSHSPNVVQNGLVLYYDAGNIKSVPKNNILGSWVDYGSNQANYNILDTYSIQLKDTTVGWTGYYPATVTSTGTYVISFTYYTDSVGTLLYDNDGIMDNLYNATLTATLTPQTYTKAIDVTTTGSIQHFFRRNSGGNMYITNVSYFKLESTLTDLYNSGINGLLDGGVKFDANNGGTLIFDGTDDRVLTSSNAKNILTTLTMECWFNASGTPSGGFHALFQKEGGFSGGAVYGLRAVPGSTIYAMICNSADTADQRFLNSTQNLVNNTWYHIASTLDSQYNWKLYINGILESTSTLTAFPFQNSSGFVIATGDGRYTNGKIPIVKLYNRALTESEIKQNFNATRGRFGI